MLRSLYLTMVFGSFLCAGLVAPFVMGLGYVWVDIFTPQNVVYSLLTELPVSLIMAAACIGMYFLNDRRYPPRFNIISLLGAAMLCWITFTTFQEAVAPELAYEKFSWAWKTVLFTLFMPCMFRSRVQIEAFLHVYIMSISGQFLPFAMKTLIGGGAYGQSFGVVAGNSGLAEGATLATACMMVSLLCLHLARFQIILPQWRIIRLGFVGLFLACGIASIGTYERTGLIGIAIVLGLVVIRSKRRLFWSAMASIAVMCFLSYLETSQSDWAVRMMTMKDPNNEGSALGRILVWQWTLEFVKDHPFGGGFCAYVVDVITFPATADNSAQVVHGKAFHSIYFEMLGEQGWPGLGIFLGIVVTCIFTLVRVRMQAKRIRGMEWCEDLATMLIGSLIVLVVCGAFIGISFQPCTYYTYALAVMLRQHLTRVREQLVIDARKVESAEASSLPLATGAAPRMPAPV